jgi:hypothetical protein
MASATATNNNSGRGNLIHVGYMVPLNHLMFENEALEHELGHLDLRFNIYSAALFYKNSNQDALHGWFDQRKRSSRMGYLRAYYSAKNGDIVIEMDVDGKQFFLIAALTTSTPPIELKKRVCAGQFGERKPFAERIQVPCFAYKYDANAGFIECESFTTFKNEQERKKEALKSEKEEKAVVA